MLSALSQGPTFLKKVIRLELISLDRISPDQLNPDDQPGPLERAPRAGPGP